jgi:hypothetical protein
MGSNMEFLTLHQLSRELNKPERVLRHKFKNLHKKNILVEGEDFIREGYIDDQHFVFKINPVRFAQLADLAPAPPLGNTGYQPVNNLDNTGYQTVTNSVTNFDANPPVSDTNRGNQKENTVATDTQESMNTSMANDFITLLKEQLHEKDKQLAEKDELLKSSNELLKQAQEQSKEKDNAQILALSEIIRLNKKLLPTKSGDPVRNVDTNGYQPGNDMDTNIGNQASEVDNNFGNNGYQSESVKHPQNNFHGDQSPSRGGDPDSLHQ